MPLVEHTAVPKVIRISVVMPMRNGAYTVIKTLDSLIEQTVTFDELVVVDDASTDGSVKIVKDFLDSKHCAYALVQHKESRGLAHSYNDGIRRSTGDLIVTLHCDVVLQGRMALELLINPLRESEKVIATYHYVDHPVELWKTYNFWQKYFFSRQVGRREYGLDGKFDCFRRSALQDVAMFDGEAFRRAGEDGDILRKLGRKGEIVKTDGGILHLHTLDPDFGIRDILYKHAQYAESQGAIYRRYGCASLRECVRAFFREIMVAMLFIPGIRVLGLILIAVYSFTYCGKLYASEWRNIRIVLVPFLNVFLLLVSCLFSAKGCLRGKQTL